MSPWCSSAYLEPSDQTSQGSSDEKLNIFHPKPYPLPRLFFFFLVVEWSGEWSLPFYPSGHPSIPSRPVKLLPSSF
uniref:Uncharacterized protein n=1 Tax=Oryza brachyantha TaxID=4533 RepID=J3LHR8_ORYBR